MSRKKTQNKTNIFLEDIIVRFHLKDDVGLGAFFGVEKSTVSAWRVKNRIPKRYIKFMESRIAAADEKQNMVSENTGTDDYTALIGQAGAVLQSGTIYAEALKQNIKAFYYGVNNEKGGERDKGLPAGTPPGALEDAAKASG